MTRPAEAGRILAGRYQLTQQLAQGMAQTYAAQCLREQQPVIVKGLHFAQLSSWKHYELFEREVRTLQHLSHPGIPRFLDSFQDPEDPEWHYLVIEQVPGQNLQQWLAQGWRPDDTAITALALQALEILDYLQRLAPPVIHRDLKPSNLILDRQTNRLYLIDFGAVQDVMRSQGNSTVVGTFGYMAPEQFSGRALPATDLYGLGATLLHLLIGCSPAELPQQELRIDFRSQLHCSRELADWLEKMLEPAPENRFGSAAQARQALLNPPSVQPARAVSFERISPPTGSQIALTHTARQLTIQIPPGPLRPTTVSIAFFAVFWNSFMAFWTVLALQGSLFFAAFSIPFWVIGFFLARIAVRSLFMQTELLFSPQSYTLEEQLGPFTKHQTGQTSEIQAVNHWVHHKINNRPVFVLEIESALQQHRFGLHLSRAEQLWLRSEILAFLLAQRSTTAGQRLLEQSQEERNWHDIRMRSAYRAD